MAIKFYFYKNPPLGENGDDTQNRQFFHPRVAGAKVRTEQDILLAFTGDLSRSAMAEGLLHSIVHQIRCFLLDGDTVRISGLGTFQTQLACRQPVDQPDITSTVTVGVSGISFRPDSQLKGFMRSAQLQRCKDYAQTLLDPQERMDNIIAMLEQDADVAVAEFSAANRCSRVTTWRDIRQLIERGRLRYVHHRLHLVDTSSDINL